MSIKAVVFDLGGVILSSPVEELKRYAKAQGLEPLFFGKVIMESGDSGSFARAERGEITMAEFAAEFEKECLASGGVKIDGKELSKAFQSAHIRPNWIRAVRAIRAAGLKTAVITNNFEYKNSEKQIEFYRRLSENFDVFVESAKVGLRKPDPRIYQLCLDKLGFQANECVYLDDLGFNLKAPKNMGFHTIRVLARDPDAALAALQALLPQIPILNLGDSSSSQPPKAKL